MQVLYTSPWVPAEWIEAHGLEPCGVWCAAGDPPAVVPEGVCAFAQAMLERSKAQPDAAVIFTTACDQMRRAADAAASIRPTRLFLVNLPATWQTPAARRLYHSEVVRLGTFLEDLGGRAPSPAALRTVMNEYDERRARLRAAIPSAPARWTAEALAGLHAHGSIPDPRIPDDLPARGAPLALVGGPLLPSQWPLFDIIASLGGRVVLNATEPSERCLLPPLPAVTDAVSPLALLADHYFDHAVDVFHRPNSRLYTWLAPRLAERGARGIVLWVHVGCDLWRAETASLREAFGLPVLLLESHDIRPGGLRDTNRLAAFVESLQ